jgi:hypothetical protein
MAEDQKPPLREAETRVRAAADLDRLRRNLVPVKVLISRVSKIDGTWVVHDAPTAFDDADPAYEQAVRCAQAWRAEDPENRCYVREELSD